MSRRKKGWVLAGLALAVVFIFLALTTHRPSSFSSKLRFLAGSEPARFWLDDSLIMTPGAGSALAQGIEEREVFVLKEDYQTVQKKAAAELASIAIPSIYGRIAGEPPMADWAIPLPRERRTISVSLEGSSNPNETYVRVSEIREPTMVDRIRIWWRKL